ncbi:hypothetical protein [Filimonas effusa]|uniref:Uncharacterized protein n=1 Tax=Filimonas effusa TaxID=2508721 RepID=A0A4Q1CZW6_9BACT|nr:hypothetical protein [Filimonas effusa]RXK80960.1 hypothetical protein ESB13_22670 [Filimonas effusa]
MTSKEKRSFSIFAVPMIMILSMSWGKGENSLKMQSIFVVLLAIIAAIVFIVNYKTFKQKPLWHKVWFWFIACMGLITLSFIFWPSLTYVFVK